MSLIHDTSSLFKTIYSHPYNRRRPIFAFKRLLRWQFHKRVSAGSRTYEFWGTRKIICYPDSSGSMWLVYNYYMDWNEFHFIRNYVRKADVIFDVGANIGIYTLWISQFLDSTGKLVAFEPDPQNFQRCRENLEINHLDSVVLEQLALSNQTGESKFSVGLDMENRLVNETASREHTTRVHSMTVDDYLKAHAVEKINFLKIDVEGAEILVFKGAQNALANSQIDVIQLEATEALHTFGYQLSDLNEALNEHGYQLYTYNLAANSLDLLGETTPQNVYAIRDLETVRRRLNRNRGLS